MARTPGFIVFLRGVLADTTLEDQRFVADSFLMEERPGDHRWDTYGDAGPTGLVPPSAPAWWGHHEAYLRSLIEFPDWSGRGPSASFDDPTLFPPLASSVGLLHVRRIDGVLLDAARAVLAGDAGAQAELNMQLDAERARRLAKAHRPRPMFAALRAEHEDVLGGPKADLDVNVLRDRLGLWHLGPHQPPFASPMVAVFAYEVKRIPGPPGSRPIMSPTVLDATLFPPFYPSPESADGRAVNLAPAGTSPHREFIHPPIELWSDDLVGIGSVDLPPVSALGLARKAHGGWWQSQGRPAFAGSLP